jgi:hypothetical protein
MPTPRTRRNKNTPAEAVRGALAPDDPLNVAAEQAAQSLEIAEARRFAAHLSDEAKAAGDAAGRRAMVAMVAPVAAATVNAMPMTAAQRLAALLAAGFSEDEAVQMLAAKAQPAAAAPLPAINPGGETGEDEFARLRAEELARYQARMRDYVPPATHETFEVTVPARTADYLRRKMHWHGESDIGRVIEVIIRTYRQNDPVRLDLESTGQTGRASSFDPKTGRFG